MSCRLTEEDSLACTRFRGVRVDDALIESARARDGLADASVSTLIRVGLAALADLGAPVDDLITRYGDRSHRRLTGYARPQLSDDDMRARGSQ